ncbi:MAG: extracellular solute-binding protein, partial [Clostridia bacterium]|nr:extracellular solute-binding protein [Clostridia bacterium]
TPEDRTKVEKGLKDYELLWSKEYPNQIMMFNNPRDAFGVALKTLGYSQNTTNEAELRAAAAKLKEQKFLYYMDEFFTAMPNDSLALGVYYAGDYLTVAAENENLKFVVPKCGTNIFNDAMCIPKNAKNQALAEKFINFMLEAEVGRDNAEYLGYSSPNKAALEIMDEDVKNDPVAYPVRQDNWEAFRDLPADTNALMRDLWAEIITENK